MKFRKKPVEIDAYLLPPDDDKTRPLPPKWFVDALVSGKITALPDGSIHINTLEGVMHGSVCDWIIQGVEGEIYPCKPAIFEKTYERA
jgi:hypothetical protein